MNDSHTFSTSTICKKNDININISNFFKARYTFLIKIEKTCFGNVEGGVFKVL